MRTIWKFELNEHINFVHMPEHAKILSVGSQRGTICLWSEVETTREKETRTLYVYGTGNPMAADDDVGLLFVGTVVGDPFVWHVFERLE